MSTHQPVSGLSAMNPHDWVRFLRPSFSESEFRDWLTSSQNNGDAEAHEKLSAHLERYQHLVREKVIQGNITGVGLETQIHRTMTCENFHKSMLSGTLHLTNPLEWSKSGDTWEAAIIAGGVVVKNRDGSSIPYTEQMRNYLNGWYAQSWSLTAECDAMWSRYTREGKRAIRISTTVRKLMLALFRDDQFHATTFLDAVRYRSEPEIDHEKTRIRFPLESENTIRPLLTLKRQAYSYESEVRLLVWDRDGENKTATGKSYDFPVKNGLSSFIEDIALDPDCPQECLETENAFIHEHGYCGTAKKSTLNDRSCSPAIITPDNLC